MRTKPDKIRTLDPIPLFDLKFLDDAKNSDKFPFQCHHCKNSFQATKKTFKDVLNPHTNAYLIYCSRKCLHSAKSKKVEIECTHCKKKIVRKLADIRKVKNSFCSISCSVTYYNLHKTFGSRRSKFEIWTEKELPKTYPNIKFLFNDKLAINSELDIYMPDLKLAIELNGIFHYEPIFGEYKFGQIQSNDNRKFQACLEQNIELAIIDVSQMKYFKEQICQKYLDIIKNIIDQNLRKWEVSIPSRINDPIV